MALTLPYFFSVVSRRALKRRRFFLPPEPPLSPSSVPGRESHTCPHSSVTTQYRNLHLLSIAYASPPRLRSRLTQGRSALPWNPRTSGLDDSHIHLATHSGILSSCTSTAPFGTASLMQQCSPTDHAFPQEYVIPWLRWRVSAPCIFGAGPLG